MNPTPLALPVSVSTMIWLTTEWGRSVIRPVFAAAGSVEPGLLKYEEVVQPCSQLPQKWHLALPFRGAVKMADLPIVTRRSDHFFSTARLKSHSPQVIFIAGRNFPSGSWGRLSEAPETPMNCSTLS